MIGMKGFTLRVFIMAVCATFVFCTQVTAVEVEIKEAGVVMDVPEVWMSKVREKKLGPGLLIRNWIRERVMIQDGKRGARPAIVAVVFPVPPDTNLTVFTRLQMQRRYNINLANMDCLKCVKYSLTQKGRVMSLFSFEPPPESAYSGPNAVSSGPRKYTEVNEVGLSLEPSWVFRGEKHHQGILMDLVVVHAKLNRKILEVSFAYPNESRAEMEPEVFSIIGSMRKE
jgi:hypothetical protein